MARVHVTRRVRRTVLIASALLAVFTPMSHAHEAAQGPAQGQPAQGQSAQGQPAQGQTFDVLQLDLCRNGGAECGSPDDAVTATIDTMRQRQPDVVTLNEVCAHDITKMLRTTDYTGEFTAAQGPDGPVPCADGRGDYGIAILSHPDQGSPGDNVVERAFDAQDGSGEQRVLLCTPYSKFSACTSNLSPQGGDIAQRQCHELADVAGGYADRTVVGGDFNLRGTDIQGCVPNNWLHTGDGNVQHVLATNTYELGDTQNLPMPGTGQPALLVNLN